ncbi:RHS repeat-associated core domain-containing protein [Pseudomonas sp. 273]|uniref:RHS repeat-associated core domain-containing protein n=1 Tax=Pseudomonas sp. 273 TaxID=75692 RepID=UPI0023D80FD4|nr:RHS repeat-associated core domain-containing protein [Pseudomonas sp. 273]
MQRLHYTPYGGNRSTPDDPQPSPANSNGTLARGFAQLHWHQASGLYLALYRAYDPESGRWLSRDPIGERGGINLYAYANGNPLKYSDPKGLAAVALCFIPGVGWTACAAMAEAAVSACAYIGSAVGGALLGGYLANEALQNDGANSGSSFPDRDLPRDKNGNPTPEPDAEGPHSQLGQKDGRNGKYDQAREFDVAGKPVRDIDFTDHGRPQNHANPHQHPYEPNPTGGTPRRGNPQPL